MWPFCTSPAGRCSGPKDYPSAATAAMPGRLDLGERHFVVPVGSSLVAAMAMNPGVAPDDLNSYEPP